MTKTIKKNKEKTYSQVVKKYGSFENFYNCTSDKHEEEQVDSELIEVIRILNREALATIACCYGHKICSEAVISFDSRVKKVDIENFLTKCGISSEMYTIKVRNRTVHDENNIRVESFDQCALLLVYKNKDIVIDKIIYYSKSLQMKQS